MLPRHATVRALALAVAASAALPGGAAAARPQFVILGENVIPVAVNVHDVAAVNVPTVPRPALSSITRHAATWQDGGLSSPLLDFNVNPTYADAIFSIAWDIADDGTVVGSAGRWYGPGAFDGADDAASWATGANAPSAVLATPPASGSRAVAKAVGADGTPAVGYATDGGQHGIASEGAYPGAVRLDDANGAGDAVGDAAASVPTLWRATGGPVALPFRIASGSDAPGQYAHPLGEDGSVVGYERDDTTGVEEGRLRRPDGSIVRLVGMGRPAAVQGGVVAGLTVGGVGVVQRPVLWKAGRLIDLLALAPAPSLWTNGVVTDLSTHGTVVGYGLLDGKQTGFMIRFRVVISGQVGPPPLRGGSMRAPRARVSATRLDDGTVATATADATGRYRLELAPGRYRVALVGGAGCAVGVRPCAPSRVVDALDDVTAAFRTDATTALAVASARAGATLRARAGKVAVTVSCRLVTRPCGGTAELRARGRLVGRATLEAPAGGRRVVRLTLTPAGRALLAAAPGPVPATLALGVRTGSRTSTSTLRVRLDG